jgi:hypothetical protein
MDDNDDDNDLSEEHRQLGENVDGDEQPLTELVVDGNLEPKIAHKNTPRRWILPKSSWRLRRGMHLCSDYKPLLRALRRNMR